MCLRLIPVRRKGNKSSRRSQPTTALATKCGDIARGCRITQIGRAQGDRPTIDVAVLLDHALRL